MVVLLLACKGPETLPDPPLPAEVLAAIPDDVLRPRVDAFEVEVDGLAEAVAAWASSGVATDRDLTRVAWSRTATLWHELEAMPLGPLASSEVSPAGRDHGGWIQSWPDVDPCAVDRSTLSGVHGTDSRGLVGLDALEHLLFAGETMACSEVDPAWDALAAEGLLEARGAHAEVIVALLVERVDDLQTDLSTYGLDATTYGSERAALEEIWRALAFLGDGFRNRRIAEPMGAGSCRVDCEALVESRGLSDASHVWLRHQLVGMRSLFTGDEGTGVPGLLAGVGRRELGPVHLERLDAIAQVLETMDGPVDAMISTSPGTLDRLLESTDEAIDVLDREIGQALDLPRMWEDPTL